MLATSLSFGVARDKFITGIKSASDDPEDLMVNASFEEAFNGEWKSDAHFVLYRPTGIAEGQDFPRINKSALTSIREAGYDVFGYAIALDWDTPNHKPWGGDCSPQDFEVQLVKACDEKPWLKDYVCAYFTRSGVRLVYALSHELPVEELEDATRWCVSEARAAGLLVDELCDWTRMFRLPKVVRDGQETWKESSFYIEVDPSAVLDVSKIGRIEKKGSSGYAAIIPIDEPIPVIETARSLVETFQRGRWVQTEWAKIAKSRLKGRECYDCIFNGTKLALPGARDQTLTKYVGQAIGMLFPVAGTTPQHVYGLFANALHTLGNDDDWHGRCWSLICRMWATERAKVEYEQKAVVEREKKAATVRERIVEGFRSWCREMPDLEDEEQLFKWCSRHFIVSSGQNYHIIDRTGHYRQQQYSASQLISAIRQHLPQEILDTYHIDRNGAYVDEAVQTLINRHCTVVQNVIGTAGVEDGYIEGIDSPEATLHISCFSRNPILVPSYSADVDRWLDLLFGDGAEDGKRWIAYSLAFEEGAICAMSLTGGSGVGKKMLVRGLAECLKSPKVATEQDITSQYQYGLIQSPFLVVNEGWPKGGGGASKHPADRFRELTTGDLQIANRRYRDPIEIRNPVRIILTANNFDVIRVLADKKDLSQEDRDALAIRLMHFDVDNKAGDWLRARGGMAFTGRPGSRWVAPDAGGKSDYVVAQHFLWLYSQRHERWKPGQRLLVEGFGSDKLMFELQTQTGSAPLVLEILIWMLNMPDHKTVKENLVDTDDGDIYTTSAGVLNFWRDKGSQLIRDEKLSLTTIKNALTGMGEDGWDPDKQRFIKGREDKKSRRWIKLDVPKLVRAVETHGFVSDRLERIASRRR